MWWVFEIQIEVVFKESTPKSQVIPWRDHGNAMGSYTTAFKGDSS